MAIAVSHKKQRSTRIGFYSIILGLCWTCTVIVSLGWNLYLQKQETREVALNVARAYIQSDNSYRRWNALQGGIYIPVEKNNIRKLPVNVVEKRNTHSVRKTFDLS